MSLKFWIVFVISRYILIYMDLAQKNHLRAYGVVYNTLRKGQKVEWLLNYRGGSFLTDYSSEVEKLCKKMGVSYEIIGENEKKEIYKIIENSNMNVLELEKAPKIALYTSYIEGPWDDAVKLVLDYAKIPYDELHDEDILKGRLKEYQWLHIHHEDFTGQWGKMAAFYRNAIWYRKMVEYDRKIARKLGFKRVADMKLAVAKKIKEFVKNGGYLFAMCSGGATFDIALAAEGIDIVDKPYDFTPPDPNCNKKLDFSKTLAFKNFKVITSPYIYEHSDIDVSKEALKRGPNTYFVLNEFSAKNDPIPTLLVQNHTRLIKEFLGQDTGFRRDKLKKYVVILGEVEGTEEVKYIFGCYGKGFFVFLGGHDPEDYTHFIGDPPTDLRKYPNSPGYRLILNNVLFPSANKEKLKT